MASSLSEPIPPLAATLGPWLDTPYINGLTGPISRSALSRALRELSLAVGAENFCLADLSRSHAEEPPQVLASSWSFDAIEIIGTSAIELLHQSPFATGLPQEPRAFATGSAARSPRVLDEPTALRVMEFGHAEMFVLKLRAGGRRGVCIFSTPVGGRMDRALVRRAHLVCNYLLSRYRDAASGGAADPLSERERECLYWVSEGKTTDEIALIIGVSGNTVNKYIVSSIQKFSASNRAMAIAIAIRNGVI
jgi:DNA-binding CsgD family transcriptional regulator